ncbi:uncharacterized protein LOC106425953 [Brassica napus]|nr:uncharacterized protein LOC106425953 [Brassica napus]
MAESMSLSQKINPRSPYYVDPDYQPDENLPMVILNQAEDNYFIWKTHFLEFLESKNKTGFCHGTVWTPDPSSGLYQPWKVCDARVKTWMMNSVSENFRNYVRFAETAHKAWEDLRAIFVPNVDLRIYQLRQRIATLRQDGDSLPGYFGKLRRVWEELSEYDPLVECACGGCRCEIMVRAKEAREKEQLTVFVMGLDKDLSYVTTHIMHIKPSPSVDQAYGLVARAESDMKSRR